jgi:hypothetical protein
VTSELRGVLSEMESRLLNAFKGDAIAKLSDSLTANLRSALPPPPPISTHTYIQAGRSTRAGPIMVDDGTDDGKGGSGSGSGLSAAATEQLLRSNAADIRRAVEEVVTVRVNDMLGELRAMKDSLRSASQPQPSFMAAGIVRTGTAAHRTSDVFADLLIALLCV